MKFLIAGLNALSIGAFLGALGVVMGAFGSHALEGKLDPDQLEAYGTAVRYQMYHALVLVALGLAAASIPRSMVGLFAIGIILFSGSIYLLVLADWSWLGPITPIGGSLLIVAWIWLTIWGFLRA